MSKIVHFEIPATDPEKSMEFYSKTFGWHFQEFAGQEYWLAITGDEKAPGINGAVMKRRDPNQPLTNAIEVESVDVSATAITKNGGQMVVPKTAIPGMGYYAFFKDPDGVILQIFEGNENAK